MRRRSMSERAVYVYVAGPLSDMPAQYLANVSNMCRASRELMEAGYVTINPAADLLDGIMSDRPLTIQQYQERSMWLLRLLAPPVHGALYVVNSMHADGRTSGGVRAEIREAERLRIPVFYSGGPLKRWRAGL